MNDSEATAMSAASTQQLRGLAELVVERRRQDRLFPHQTPGTFELDRDATLILVEECLEVVQGQQDPTKTIEDVRGELVHLGAVVVKLLEHIELFEFTQLSPKRRYQIRSDP